MARTTVADDEPQGRPTTPDDTRPSAADRVGGVASAVAGAVKPRLRGWIHAGTFPIALVGSIILVVLAEPGAGRVATAVFGLSSILLFGTSAVYHLGTWSPKVTGILRRADHSNIFLIIAGSYTPLAVYLLSPSAARILLIIVWTGAILGLAARIIWLGAPRWVYVPIYLALGWVAVGYMPVFWKADVGPTAVLLVAAGGLAYTLGAVVYGLKRPNPSPRWFGFHEIFHVLTVVGFGFHFAAVAVAVVASR
ncbi:PAQR family membrane homeostasis protein TrhA [Sanguibacter antarcticus]|uniref:Hemolysin III n=1 Tax=Sanguibacter antarcticus TaxID=372484 RepID=A0A2A9E1M1_9MICO|nr:hemolysin III family protein [Sanguibacter antarcticus]PFG32471.1 hemolysin III [Sanguibacter antarcticus]